MTKLLGQCCRIFIELNFSKHLVDIASNRQHMQLFLRNCTHILTRTQEKFDDMFLVKIANKGTSLSDE